MPANYPEIERVAEKYHLLVLEDGAQGFGGMIGERRACSFGDAATTSFLSLIHILEELLNKLHENPEELEKMKKNIDDVLEKNTWKCRAAQVEKDLLRVK